MVGKTVESVEFGTHAGKLGLDVPPGTLNSVLKQAGLKD